MERPRIVDVQNVHGNVHVMWANPFWVMESLDENYNYFFCTKMKLIIIFLKNDKHIYMCACTQDQG